MHFIAGRILGLMAFSLTSFLLTSCVCGPNPDGSDGFFGENDWRVQETKEIEVRCGKLPASSRETCQQRETKEAETRFQQKMEKWNKCMEEVQ